MATEQITVIIKDVAQLKGLVQLRQNLEAMQRVGIDVNKRLRTVDNRIKSMGVSVKRSTIAFRRFRAELLSVMFFGMAINRVFSMMLQPALKLVGLFELWSSTLAILFLPIALQLLDILLPIMDFLINLPEPVQNAIGVFVLFGLVLGKLIMLFGIIGLGIFGMQQAFGAMGPAIIGTLGKIGAFLTGVFGVGLGIILAGAVLLIIGFISAWKTNFGNIRQWTQVFFEGVKDIFKGFWKFVKGIWKVISGFLTGDVDKIVEGLKLLWQGFKQFVGGIVKAIIGFVVSVGLAILRLITNIFNSIVGLIKRVGSFVGGLFGFGGGTESTNITNTTVNFSPTTNISTTGGIDSAGIKAGLNESFARGVGDLSRSRAGG